MGSIRVLHMLPDLRLGGGQMLLLRNIEAMRPLGVESGVCAVWRDEGPTMTPRFKEAGIPVFSLKMRRSRLPITIWKLVDFVRENKIDLIHTNNTGWDRRLGVIAGRIASVPVVNSFHSMKFRPVPFVDGIDRLCLRNGYTAGIAVSGTVKDAWVPHCASIGLSEDRLQVVHPGLDLEEYRPRAEARERTRAALGIPNDAPVIVNVARLVPGKGHLALLESMRFISKVHPRARLVLVGDGSERSAIESEARRLGLSRNVVLLGQRDDVAELVGASDVFMFTSEGEGFGLVIMEAMACAVPVVAFELPVLREIVPEQAGVLVGQGACEALAAEVSKLLADPERRKQMGARARQEVELEFSREGSAEKLVSVYARVLGRAAPTGPSPELVEPASKPDERVPAA